MTKRKPTCGQEEWIDRFCEAFMLDARAEANRAASNMFKHHAHMEPEAAVELYHEVS